MPQRSAQSNGRPKDFLRKRTDFLATYKGRFVKKDLLVLYALENKQLFHRFGITASKAVGPAVVRNRFKRWSREIYRAADFSGFPEAMDLNVVIGNKRRKKEEMRNAKFGDFQEQLVQALSTLMRIRK